MRKIGLLTVLVAATVLLVGAPAGACGGLVGENGTHPARPHDDARRVPRRRRALRHVASSSPARARRSARSCRCPACRRRSSGAATGRCNASSARCATARRWRSRPRRRGRRGRQGRSAPDRRRSTRSTSRSCAAVGTRSASGRSTTGSSSRRTRRRCSTSTRSAARSSWPRASTRVAPPTLGQGSGDGTPIMLTIPTDEPWVPLRILCLGLGKAQVVEADVFLLTDDRPMLRAGETGLSSRAATRPRRLCSPTCAPTRAWRGYPTTCGSRTCGSTRRPANLNYDLAVSTHDDVLPSARMAGIGLHGGPDSGPLTVGGSGFPAWDVVAIAGGLLVLLSVIAVARRRARPRVTS